MVSRFRHALVTGGAGFIGSRLSAALLDRGLGVTVLDNLSVGTRERVDPRARLVEGDVRDPAAVADALKGVDSIYHLAAQVTIRGSFDRFYEDLDTNLMGTANLIRTLDPEQVRWFVLASSMAVYADSPTPTPMREDAPTEPISPYGIGKLAAERVASQILEQRGVPLTVVRYFNTYGPGQTYTPYVGVLTIFITRLLAGQAPVVLGDGAQQRDFIHVDDIVDGTMAGVGRATGIYNLGTGRGLSLTDLARLLVDRLAPSLSPVYEAARPGELRYSIADIDAARRALSFDPVRSLDTSLDEIVADIRKRAITL